MAQVFYVTCPRCSDKFPCHPELWQVEYALLCPFCQLSFHQEESPMIITGAGERRPGSQYGRDDGARAPAAASHSTSTNVDPTSQAESM